METNTRNVNRILDALLKNATTDLLTEYPDMVIQPDTNDQIKINTIISNWKKITDTELTIVKQKPNDSCKCGSGKKYKKCCRIIHMYDNIYRDIQYELRMKTEIAVKLYNNSVREGLKLLNPDEYLQRQCINRVLFKRLKLMVEEHDLHEELESTTTYKYFECMYNLWPSWTKYIINYFDNNTNTDTPDIVEIYYNLTKF